MTLRHLFLTASMAFVVNAMETPVSSPTTARLACMIHSDQQFQSVYPKTFRGAESLTAKDVNHAQNMSQESVNLEMAKQYIRPYVAPLMALKEALAQDDIRFGRIQRTLIYIKIYVDQKMINTPFVVDIATTRARINNQKDINGLLNPMNRKIDEPEITRLMTNAATMDPVSDMTPVTTWYDSVNQNVLTSLDNLKTSLWSSIPEARKAAYDAMITNQTREFEPYLTTS